MSKYSDAADQIPDYPEDDNSGKSKYALAAEDADKVINAKPSSIKQPEKPNEAIHASSELGVLEAGARMGSATLAALPSSLYQIATGDKEKASYIQRGLTYKPRTVEGKTISDIVESKYDPLTWPGRVTSAVGEATGSPRLEAAGNLALLGFGAKGMKGAPVEVGELPLNVDVGGGLVHDLKQTPAPKENTTLTPDFMLHPAQISEFIKEKLPNASPDIKQEVVAKRDAGKTIDGQTLARHLEADSLPVPMKLTTGQASQDVNLLSREQNNRGKQPELASIFNQQNGHLIENINAIRDKTSPDVTGADHVDNGRALMDAYKAKDEARQSEVDANYKKLADANGGSIPIDGKAFAEDVKQRLGSGGLVSQDEFLPSRVKSIVDKISNSDKSMTMDDFVNLRKILSKEVNSASRSGDGNAVGAIKTVRDSLENIPMGENASALKPIADQAKNSARQLFKDREKDPAWSAVHEESVKPDDFVKKFVVGGKVDDVAAMRKNLSDNPIADQTIKAGAINYLKDRAGIVRENGNFSQAGYNKGLQQIAPKIQHLVDDKTAAHLNALGNVARNTQFQPRGSYVNNSGTLVGHLAEKAGGAVEQAINLKTFGGGTAVRNMLDRRRAAKELEESVKPAGGISLSDIGKK